LHPELKLYLTIFLIVLGSATKNKTETTKKGKGRQQQSDRLASTLRIAECKKRGGDAIAYAVLIFTLNIQKQPILLSLFYSCMIWFNYKDEKISFVKMKIVYVIMKGIISVVL